MKLQVSNLCSTECTHRVLGWIQHRQIASAACFILNVRMSGLWSSSIWSIIREISLGQVTASASFSIWCVVFLFSDIGWDAYATGFQESLFCCSGTIPSPNTLCSVVHGVAGEFLLGSENWLLIPHESAYSLWEGIISRIAEVFSRVCPDVLVKCPGTSPLSGGICPFLESVLLCFQKSLNFIIMELCTFLSASLVFTEVRTLSASSPRPGSRVQCSLDSDFEFVWGLRLCKTARNTVATHQGLWCWTDWEAIGKGLPYHCYLLVVCNE